MDVGEAAKRQGLPLVVIGTSTAVNGTTSGGGSGLFSKARYKFWAIVLILLMAFWSMFTVVVTFYWSVGNINNHISDAYDSPLRDLDILEVEEREKLVRKFWNMYTHSKTIRLPRFWQEAFEAAYEYLTSDVSGVRNNAVSEIARMSLVTVDVEPPSVSNADVRGRRKKILRRSEGQTKHQ